MRSRLYNGSLPLYEDADLLGELRRLRTRYTPNQAAVFNPRVKGSHGDRVAALALGCLQFRPAPPSHRGIRLGRGRIGFADRALTRQHSTFSLDDV
jgi:hypothetical protein